MAIKKPVKAYKNLDFLNSPAARELRILSEFIEPRNRLNKHKIVDTIVFFGSARLLSKKEAENNHRKVMQDSQSSQHDKRKAEVMLKNSKYYEDAVELSRRMTLWSKKRFGNQQRYVVCTGGGPGIMEAANKGSQLAGGKSIGLNISLPYEAANPYIDDDLNFEFHYFFMRKFWFAYPAKAIVIFPGGFGTFDELFEILTLVQTQKIKKQMKILIYDKEYWLGIVNFNKMVENGVISPEDLNLFTLCESVDQMEQELTSHLEQIKHQPKLM